MTTPTIRLSSPVDIITSLPYQLGFHPTRSAVVVCLHDTRVGLVMRLDLPPDEHIPEALAAIIEPMRREAPTGVVLVGYEDTEGESIPFLTMLRASVGVKVHDVLVVRDDRWYSLTCDDSECCPPDGTPLEASNYVSAQFVVQGKNPLSNREATVARLEYDGVLAITVATDSSQVETHLGLQGWGSIFGNIGTMTEGHIRMAAALLHNVDFRDGLIGLMNPGTISLDLIAPEVAEVLSLLPEMADGGIDRLIALCAALPDEYATPALTVLASYAWHQGDGTIARIALDRALRADPNYRLAQLLERMVTLGVRDPNKEN